MSDWKQEVKLKRNDAFKAAAIILGMLFACLIALWLLTRMLHKRSPAPPPATNPAAPAPSAPPRP